MYKRQGFVTVTCACDEQGNVEMADLRVKAEENKDELAALMITYPSTHGDRKSTRLNSSHLKLSRMPSSA